jgi:hypothetical protein
MTENRLSRLLNGAIPHFAEGAGPDYGGDHMS